MAFTQGWWGLNLFIATKNFPQLLSPTRRVRRSLIKPLPGMIHRERTLVGSDVKKMENGGARYLLRKPQIIRSQGRIVKLPIHIEGQAE